MRSPFWTVFNAFLALCWPVPAAWAEGAPVRIYIDADWTAARASAVAIERGLRTALDEAGDLLDGRRVEIVTKDHRGSSPRSKRHLQQFLQDERALAVFSGMHSPPLLAHRRFINESGILVLDPWAAAGPITRYAAGENWIFRLSVDDTKAGRVIVRHAVLERGFKRPYLLLEDTGWGQSNQRTMGAALKELDVAPAGTAWFKWDMGRPRARALLREVEAAGADVVLLVANAMEAATLIQEMDGLGMGLPVCSHWGITGGDFTAQVGAPLRERVSLAFIQTRFSFVSHPRDPLGQAVLSRAMALYPGQIRGAEDIQAPTGFIHAFDLGRILAAAAGQAGLTGDMAVDRPRVRAALEDLRRPVEGLVKTYRRPFAPFSAAAPDAHEALGLEDLVMARYGERGEILLLSAPPIER